MAAQSRLYRLELLLCSNLLQPISSRVAAPCPDHIFDGAHDIWHVEASHSVCHLGFGPYWLVRFSCSARRRCTVCGRPCKECCKFAVFNLGSSCCRSKALLIFSALCGVFAALPPRDVQPLSFVVHDHFADMMRTGLCAPDRRCTTLTSISCVKSSVHMQFHHTPMALISRSLLHFLFEGLVLVLVWRVIFGTSIQYVMFYTSFGLYRNRPQCLAWNSTVGLIWCGGVCGSGGLAGGWVRRWWWEGERTLNFFECSPSGITWFPTPTNTWRAEECRCASAVDDHHSRARC